MPAEPKQHPQATSTLLDEELLGQLIIMFRGCRSSWPKKENNIHLVTTLGAIPLHERQKAGVDSDGDQGVVGWGQNKRERGMKEEVCPEIRAACDPN